MPLILRLDIDKPFGRASLKEKVLSKLAEDYVEFKFQKLGFLNHLPPFFDLLDKHKISSYVYFRNCCLPTPALVNRLESRGDVIGFHAEDTKSEGSFLRELGEFSNKINREVKDFSKHGSGQLKLGKRHFAPYDETSYRAWAKKSNLNFPFGNGICSEQTLFEASDFYPDMFWVEPHYRNLDKFNLDWLRQNVKTKIIPIITHPENIYADTATKKEFQILLDNFADDFISPAQFQKNFLTD